MAEWQEKSEDCIGNTVELFDAPIGHFSRNPKGRGPFGLWRRRSSLMGCLAHFAPHSWPATKMTSVAAIR
jgi:hypothetical protein